MLVREAIIQGIHKNAGSTLTSEHFREQQLQLDERLQKLGDGLLRVYSKLTNNYGCFDIDQETYRFEHHLDRYTSQLINFVEFSKITSKLVADRMSAATSATGGYVCFLRYENAGRDWLLIAMLKLTPGTGIDPESLELNETLALDINQLHEAARIDLQKWRGEDQPYLSFIKRSGRQDEVTRYFRLALGCTNYTDSKSNTEHLLKAVSDFCEIMGWNADQRRKARQQTFDYLDEKSKNKEHANIISLSGRINDQEPEAFIDFIRTTNAPISETFEPHRKTFTKFKRITEKFGNVSLGFDVQDVIDGRVDYDHETHHLVIGDPPISLIKKIDEAKGHATSQ